MARRAAAGGETWVAFLRGVNVGGRNLVPMAALRELFAKLGHADVRTHLQSGNVVFRAPGAEGELAAELEKAIAKRFGFPVGIVVRSGAEMCRIAARCPYPDANPSHLLVIFCAGKPKGRPDPARSPQDVFELRGREFYVHYANIARSKLSLDYIERCTGTVGTGRNWRTVTTLAGWTAEPRTRA